MLCRAPKTCKVSCMCYSSIFLNQTPIFNWCVVQWGSKNKHHTYTCLKEIGVRLQVFINYSTLNSEFNKHALPITLTKSWEMWPSNRFLIMIHHRFVNAIQVSSCKFDRNWRTWKMNQTSPTYPRGWNTGSMGKEGDRHIPPRRYTNIVAKWTEHPHVSGKVCGCYLVEFSCSPTSTN